MFCLFLYNPLASRDQIWSQLPAFWEFVALVNTTVYDYKNLLKTGIFLYLTVPVGNLYPSYMLREYRGSWVVSPGNRRTQPKDRREWPRSPLTFSLNLHDQGECQLNDRLSDRETMSKAPRYSVDRTTRISYTPIHRQRPTETNSRTGEER